MKNKDPILVVEDSDEDFDTISEAAKKAGHPNELIRARDAAEAEAIVAVHQAKRLPFALVILDYNLPGKSGVELLRDFGKSELRSRVPVVFFTTSTSLQDCRECYEAGANAYHTKALRYEECVHTLECIFEYWLRQAMFPTSPN